MTRYRKPSKSTCLTLQKLITGPAYGYEIMKATGLKSGTLYPILMRLTERGLLSSHWDTPLAPGKPPRQIYELTADGRAWVLDVTISKNTRKAPKEIRA